MAKEISIEVKDVQIHYKMMKKFSIQRNLLKRDAEKAEIFEAVKGVSFNVEKGEILGIIGKNGSGKSTFINFSITFWISPISNNPKYIVIM